MYVRQLQLGPMKNFVYVIGDDASADVVVIDPAWDVEAIERCVRSDGRKIAGLVVSHCHGDHINGLPGLLARHDVPVYAQRAEIDFSPELREVKGALRPMAPGEALQLGALTLTLLHTPGHTPGSQCVLASGALFSGDTVFVNACGRCDLKGGNPEDMYRSISSVLMKLDPRTQLFPGHDYGDVPVSSLARERERNPYFAFHELSEFVAFRMRPRT